jgi:hypothetical protein
VRPARQRIGSPRTCVATVATVAKTLVLPLQLAESCFWYEARTASTKADNEEKVFESKAHCPESNLNNRLRLQRIGPAFSAGTRAARAVIGRELLKIRDLLDGVFDHRGNHRPRQLDVGERLAQLGAKVFALTENDQMEMNDPTIALRFICHLSAACGGLDTGARHSISGRVV